MKAITVKEYSELYNVPIRTINDQLKREVMPDGVTNVINAGKGKTATKLLVMSEEKKVPKKVGVFLG